MRLIIKPAGLALLVLAFVCLSVFAVTSRQGTHTPVETAQPKVAKVPDANGITATMTPFSGQKTEDVVLKTEEKELIKGTNFDSQQWQIASGTAGASEERIFDSHLHRFPKMRKLTLTKAVSNPWDVQYRQTIPDGFSTGVHLRLRVWARSKDSLPITVVCEQNKDPYEKLATREFTLTPEWQQLEMEWTADKDIAAGWAQVDIQAGGRVGEIDIAGASLTVSAVSTSAVSK